MPRTDKTRTRKKLPPSTQLLITTLILVGITLLLGGISLIPSNSPALALTILLVGLVLGTFTASIAFICAIVGFFKFSRYRILNIVLALVAIVINPTVISFFLVASL